MKKVILAVFSLLTISAASYSQATPAKKAAPDKTKAAAPADKKDPAKVVPMDNSAKTTTTKTTATKTTKTTTPAATAAPAAAKTTKTAAPAAAPAKTTKAAAPAATPAGPVKKDGTPDKRYKENKTTTPTKKDGTPDMRYKENKAKPKN